MDTYLTSSIELFKQFLFSELSWIFFAKLIQVILIPILIVEIIGIEKIIEWSTRLTESINLKLSHVKSDLSTRYLRAGYVRSSIYKIKKQINKLQHEKQSVVCVQTARLSDLMRLEYNLATHCQEVISVSLNTYKNVTSLSLSEANILFLDEANKPMLETFKYALPSDKRAEIYFCYDWSTQINSAMHVFNDVDTDQRFSALLSRKDKKALIRYSYQWLRLLKNKNTHELKSEDIRKEMRAASILLKNSKRVAKKHKEIKRRIKQYDSDFIEPYSQKLNILNNELIDIDRENAHSLTHLIIVMMSLLISIIPIAIAGFIILLSMMLITLELLNVFYSLNDLNAQIQYHWNNNFVPFIFLLIVSVALTFMFMQPFFRKLLSWVDIVVGQFTDWLIEKFARLKYSVHLGFLKWIILKPLKPLKNQKLKVKLQVSALIAFMTTLVIELAIAFSNIKLIDLP
jgi:hypothetical protein